MCNNEAMFSDLQALQNPLNVTLGDGRDLHAVGRGNVVLTMNLPQDKTESCTLHDVLLVPDLAYNLVSVTAASKKGKVTTFSEMKCEIRDYKSKLVATRHRDGSLYYLGPIHKACSSSNHNTKETNWHRRFGHLSFTGMQALSKNKMVTGLDFDWKKKSSFCESCVEGKIHRLPLQRSHAKRTDNALELVHSDVCGKIGTQEVNTSSRSLMTIPDTYGSIS